MNDVASQALTQQERYWLDHIQQAQVSNQSLTKYAQAPLKQRRCHPNCAA